MSSSTKPTETREAGRPPKPLDWDKVDKLLMAGCSGQQAAACFDIHPDTLYNRCQSEKGMVFTEYSAIQRQKGNSVLHGKQFDVAMEGNTTMLIWLGKQRLDQRETVHQALDPETIAQSAAVLEQLRQAREERQSSRKIDINNNINE